MTSFSTRKTRLTASFVREFRLRSIAGFSLVEIAIALGIVSFVLIALMGLMSVGLNEARRGREDTLLASMTSYRMTSLLGAGYANVTNTTAYFTYDGLESSPTNAYYVCKITSQAPALARPDLSTTALQ